jgi:hypothetical protein
MRVARFLIIVISLVVVLAALAAILTNCTSEEVIVVGIDRTKPPLDTIRPSVTETATFALG